MHQFQLVNQTAIDSLACQAYYYKHPSGMSYCHLERDSDEKTFYIAFKTLPPSSNGVAHILEHTTLCGSKKFPVSDPFFAMLRRSVNTFMNAMTSSDWTCYPFATRNSKDYQNLLDIYIDAVFNPKLKLESFCQEGHRLEQNDMGKWVRSGVVFNEMIGSMGSLSSRQWEQLSDCLFPNTPYAFNSGGAPLEIPDLTYQGLLDFHRSRYSVSNALVASSGNFAVESLLETLEAQIQSQSTNQPIPQPAAEQLGSSLKLQDVMDHSVACYPNDQIEQSDVVNIVWRLDECQTPLAMLEIQLLEELLLGNAASALRVQLDNSPLGKSLSGLTGYGEITPVSFFGAGLAGVKSTCTTDEVTTFIHHAMAQCQQQEFSVKQVTSALDSIEFSQRNLSSSMPIGLDISMELLHPWILNHDQKMIDYLDRDADLNRLRDNCQDSSYINQLIERYILQNKQQSVMRLVADKTLSASEQLQREQQVETYIAKLNKPQLESYTNADANHKLWMNQPSKDDLSLLPKITPNELQAPEKFISPTEISPGKWLAQAPTNGIMELQINLPVTAQMLTELPLTPMLADSLTKIGVEDLDYLTTQQTQAEIFGTINSQIRWLLDRTQAPVGTLELNCKFLPRKLEQVLPMLQKILVSPNFSQLDRLQSLIEQRAVAYQNNIWGNAHQLAMLTANSDLISRINSAASGLFGRAKFKKLLNNIDKNKINQTAQAFQAGMNEAVKNAKVMLLIPQTENFANIEQQLINWQFNSTAGTLPDSKDIINTALASNCGSTIWTPAPNINYCAYNIPVSFAAGSAQIAHLHLLAELIKHGSLHPVIREKGGAYGAGAVASATSGLTFFSYRDPRCDETFADFHNSLNNIDAVLDEDSFESAKLVIINKLDSQGEIPDQMLASYYRSLLAKTPQETQVIRNYALQATSQDIKAMATLLLQHYQQGNACAIVDEQRAKTFQYKPASQHQI